MSGLKYLLCAIAICLALGLVHGTESPSEFFKDQGLKLLGGAVKLTGLDEATHAGSVEATIFAPNDEAFKKLGEKLKSRGLIEDTDRPRQFVKEHEDEVREILKYHYVPGKAYTSSDAKDGTYKLKTKQGSEIGVCVSDGGKKIVVRGAHGSSGKVLKADLKYGQAVVHIIDGVLLPPKKGPKGYGRLRV